MRTRSNTRKQRNGETVHFKVYNCTTEMRGHATITQRRLDELVRDAVVDALYEQKDAPLTGDGEAQLALLHKEMAEARAGEARLARLVKAGAISEAAAIREGRETQAEIKRISADIDALTQQVAAASVDEALWTEIWANASGPALTPAGPGRQRFHGSRAIVQSLMRRRGFSEEEAKAKAALYHRFDALSLDQRRALIRSHLHVTVAPGIERDRVSVQPV
jgi:hypothetical protein